jgi:two-component system, chemotaxis family, chemotaxis protein CheY
MTHAPILVVDDDPSIRETVKAILDLEGYVVVTATDGQDALRVIEQAQPALVVLDMRMPIMDGWSFAEALAGRGVHVPILVMTAAQNARTWAREIGAAGYVAKPFEIPELLDAVARLSPPS